MADEEREEKKKVKTSTKSNGNDKDKERDDNDKEKEKERENNNNNKRRRSSSTFEKEQLLEKLSSKEAPNLIFWIKIKSFPEWPGRLCSEEEIAAIKPKLGNDELLVCFFGTNEYEIVKKGQFHGTYDPNDKETVKRTKKSKSKAFLTAVQTAKTWFNTDVASREYPKAEDIKKSGKKADTEPSMSDIEGEDEEDSKPVKKQKTEKGSSSSTSKSKAVSTSSKSKGKKKSEAASSTESSKKSKEKETSSSTSKSTKAKGGASSKSKKGKKDADGSDTEDKKNYEYLKLNKDRSSPEEQEKLEHRREIMRKLGLWPPSEE